eukprot:1585730-Lingulodinium_polyedra.AAC.1
MGGRGSCGGTGQPAGPPRRRHRGFAAPSRWPARRAAARRVATSANEPVLSVANLVPVRLTARGAGQGW